MKSVYACLVVFVLAISLAGCGGKKENSLANENLTEDDFAKYEADLAAAMGDDAGYDEDTEE